MRRAWMVLVAVVLVASPVAVLADDRFDDVPTADPLHDDVGALAGAGIVRGCGAGSNFCPERAVTRAQVAQLLDRGLPRTASTRADGAVVLRPSSGWVAEESVVTELTIEVPGLAGSQQLVALQAAVGAFVQDDVSGCPCLARFHLADEGLRRVSAWQ